MKDWTYRDEDYWKRYDRAGSAKPCKKNKPAWRVKEGTIPYHLVKIIITLLIMGAVVYITSRPAVVELINFINEF